MKNSFSLRYVVAPLCGFLGAFASVMQAEGANSIHVDLYGYAVSDDSAVRITEVLPPANPAFAVEVDHDGRGVSVSCPKTFEPNGLLAETWRVRTNDREVPELALPMSACMQSVVDVVPPQIVVDRRDSAYRCVVRIRSRPGVASPNEVSAVAKPRMWGGDDGFPGES